VFVGVGVWGSRRNCIAKTGKLVLNGTDKEPVNVPTEWRAQGGPSLKTKKHQLRKRKVGQAKICQPGCEHRGPPKKKKKHGSGWGTF